MLDPVHIEFAVKSALTLLVALLVALIVRRRFPAIACGRTTALAACLLASLSYFLVFTFLCFKRYDAFNAGMVDFGGMDQAIWNTLQGRFLEVTSLDWGQIRRLGAHVEPTFALLSPVYLLWDDPRALLFVQTLLVASGAIPVFLWTRRNVGGSGTALALALAYLAFPALQFANRFDFHGDTIAVPFLLLAMHFLFKGQRLWYWVMAVLAMGCKEYIPLVFAGLGVYLLLEKKHRLTGLLSMGLGAAWFLAAVLVIIPGFGKEVHPYYVSQGYQHLGGRGGIGGVLRKLVEDPLAFPASLLSLDKAGYLVLLLLPLGFLPILSPRLLLPALPVLGILLLHPGIADIRNHHSSPLVPFLVLAAGAGIKTIERRFEGRGPLRAALVAYLLACSLLASVFIGPSPLALKFWSPDEWEYWGQLHNYRVTAHDRIAQSVIAGIEPDAVVSSSKDLAGHLGHRMYCWCFPYPLGLERVDVVALNLFEAYTPSFWPVEQEALARAELFADSRFQLVAHRDGVVLFSRKTEAGRGLEATIASTVSEPGRGCQGCLEEEAAVKLVALEIAREGSVLTFKATWRACAELDGKVMPVTVLSEGGAQHRFVHLPSYAARPMHTWRRGEQITETFQADLPPAFGASAVEVHTGIFREKPGYPVLTNPQENVPWNKSDPIWVAALGSLDSARTRGTLFTYRCAETATRPGQKSD